MPDTGIMEKDSDRTLSPGQIVKDKYRIEKLVARGGMAYLYKGYYLGHSDFLLPVALKELLPHLARYRGVVKLFLSEARIHSHLRHANIVQLLDILIDDGRYFLVMEWVDGMDLRRLLKKLRRRRRSMPLDVAMYIFHELFQALYYAHWVKLPDASGLVHRDISPSNIMVSMAGEVKLTDFGIAHAGRRLEPFKRVLGKKGYMAPEQWDGTIGDFKSDIFSVMVCFYEALAMERPFAAEAFREPGEHMPIPIRERRPDIPEPLESLISDGLSWDPGARPSALTALRRIEDIASHYRIPLSFVNLVDLIHELGAR